MKIVVTGDRGFLGSRLAEKLKSRHKVTGLNRTVGDISNFKVVHDFITMYNPDLVIHCAAIGDIQRCEENKELAYKSNYIATKNIAAACADNNSGMIYISSDQVYNYYSGEPITELTPVNPTNYYGFLKAEAEKDVRYIVPKSHIARIAWQYDSYKPGADDSRGGLMRLVGEAVSSNTPIYCNPDSYQYTSYVQDTVEVLIKMAEQVIPYGVYNIAQKTEKTLKQVFEFVMKELGADEDTVKRLVLPRDDGKAKRLCARPFNLEMCGYKLPAFEESIQRCIRDNK